MTWLMTGRSGRDLRAMAEWVERDAQLTALSRPLTAPTLERVLLFQIFYKWDPEREIPCTRILENANDCDTSLLSQLEMRCRREAERVRAR